MRCNWRRWLWGIIPLLVLSWVAVQAEHGRLERDLTERTRAALNQGGFPWALAEFKARDAALTGHPTTKPVAMIADAILDCSDRGGLILDPFLGSGTTLLAAEQTGRHGAGIEIDPHYVDLAAERISRFAKAPIIHAETGLTFDEIKIARAAQIQGGGQ